MGRSPGTKLPKPTPDIVKDAKAAFWDDMRDDLRGLTRRGEDRDAKADAARQKEQDAELGRRIREARAEEDKANKQADADQVIERAAMQTRDPVIPGKMKPKR